MHLGQKTPFGSELSPPSTAKTLKLLHKVPQLYSALLSLLRSQGIHNVAPAGTTLPGPQLPQLVIHSFDKL